MRKAVYKGYTVYSNGLIKKKRGSGYIAGCFKDGYQFAVLNGENYWVHRFIWEAFNGTIPADCEIDHIDNNRSNNRLDNLQLLTHAENMSKSTQIFNKKQLDEIRYLREDLRWTLQRIADRFGVVKSTIHKLEQNNFQYIY